MLHSFITSVSDQPPPATAQGGSLSLLERIGGMRRVHQLVDRFIHELGSNGEVAVLLGSIDLAAFKKAQVAFFTEAFGGYLPNMGEDTRSAHLTLEAEAFVSVVVLLNAALLSLGLSEDLHEELVLAIASSALA
jgi:truncated hemoglobin YjbI